AAAPPFSWRKLYADGRVWSENYHTLRQQVTLEREGTILFRGWRVCWPGTGKSSDKESIEAIGG
ncbi:MAG: hypothetical protein WBS18_15185, partial [Candidatus Acidiferrales bacterium]